VLFSTHSFKKASVLPSSSTTMSTTSIGTLFFYSEDPRSTMIVGHEGDRPIFYQFETKTMYSSTTRTEISIGSGSGNSRRVVANFDWTSGTHLGMATVGSNNFPMSHFVTTRSNKYVPSHTSLLRQVVMAGICSRRQFVHRRDGRVYEWHRTERDEYEVRFFWRYNLLKVSYYWASLASDPNQCCQYSAGLVCGSTSEHTVRHCLRRVDVRFPQ
jgi:hypothetical protein